MPNTRCDSPPETSGVASNYQMWDTAYAAENEAVTTKKPARRRPGFGTATAASKPITEGPKGSDYLCANDSLSTNANLPYGSRPDLHTGSTLAQAQLQRRARNSK